MKNEQEYIRIRELILSIVNKVNTFENSPHNFGTDELLYASELLMIESLGYRPNVNVTEYAENHGITKGAVSQLVNKLEKKGLVARHKHPANQKEVLLELTTKGEIAFHNRKLMRLQIVKAFFERFEGMELKELDLITHFLSSVESVFDEINKMDSKI